jgi:hypothetical protein
MRQQYDRINQSIFNNNLFSSLVCGSSPQTKWRILRQRLDVVMVEQQKVTVAERLVPRSSAKVKAARKPKARACDVEGKRHARLWLGYQVTDGNGKTLRPSKWVDRPALCQSTNQANRSHSTFFSCIWTCYSAYADKRSERKTRRNAQHKLNLRVVRPEETQSLRPESKI